MFQYRTFLPALNNLHYSIKKNEQLTNFKVIKLTLCDPLFVIMTTKFTPFDPLCIITHNKSTLFDPLCVIMNIKLTSFDPLCVIIIIKSTLCDPLCIIMNIKSTIFWLLTYCASLWNNDKRQSLLIRIIKWQK